MDTSSFQVPLAVDLDGSLLRSDLLHESALKLLRERPLEALATLHWLVQGKAYLKQQIAERIDLDIKTLPFDVDVLAWLRSEHSLGRRIILCTASDKRFALSLIHI